MKTTTFVLGAVVAAWIPSVAHADHRTTSSNLLGEVNFRFDSSALQGDAPPVIGNVVKLAEARSDMRIVLDAHCDPIGTSVYNIGLAIRRAQSVKAELIANGVSADQIVLAIYGEEGERRPTFAGDRRVTIWATRKALASVIDVTFAGRGTAVTWGPPMTVAEIAGEPTPIASR